jgi:hypothetical protein
MNLTPCDRLRFMSRWATQTDCAPLFQTGLIARQNEVGEKHLFNFRLLKIDQGDLRFKPGFTNAPGNPFCLLSPSFTITRVFPFLSLAPMRLRRTLRLRQLTRTVRQYGQIRLHNFGLYVDQGLWGHRVEVWVYDDVVRIEQGEQVVVSYPCVYDP